MKCRFNFFFIMHNMFTFFLARQYGHLELSKTSITIRYMQPSNWSNQSNLVPGMAAKSGPSLRSLTISTDITNIQHVVNFHSHLRYFSLSCCTHFSACVGVCPCILFLFTHFRSEQPSAELERPFLDFRKAIDARLTNGNKNSTYSHYSYASNGTMWQTDLYFLIIFHWDEAEPCAFVLVFPRWLWLSTTMIAKI